MSCPGKIRRERSCQKRADLPQKLNCESISGVNGRLYKKLNPVVPLYREQLEDFLTRFWDYYGKLLEYKEHPTCGQAKKLSTEFDELFSTKTRYYALDDRIEKTKAKKEELLKVLKYP